MGTVVGFHGSPGSHNDFKYIRDKFDNMNIRFIGINYPGFTHTEGSAIRSSQKNVLSFRL